MTSDPDQPSRGDEHPSPANTPPHADPHAPLDYPDDPGLPPAVYPTQYPYPPAPPNHPTAPPGYPLPPPGYPGAAGGWYPPTYPPAYDPYQPAKPPGTNGMAIASLVCSLAGVLCCVPSIVGLILGIIAMRETKRTGQEGHGIALAGTIVGAVVLGASVLYLLVSLLVYAGSPTQYTP